MGLEASAKAFGKEMRLELGQERGGAMKILPNTFL